MRSEVKEPSLVLYVEVENNTKTSAPQGYHGSCLVVCLSYVRLKEVLVIYLFERIVVLAQAFGLF